MSMIAGQVNVTLLHEMILLHDSVWEGAVKVARPIGKPTDLNETRTHDHALHEHLL